MQKITEMKSEDLFKLINMSIVEIKNINISKEDFIKSLPIAIVSELMLFILKLNNLTDEDKKKL